MTNKPEQALTPEQEARRRFWWIRMTYHQYWDKDIDRAVAMLQESITLAKQLNDKKGTLEMQHWLMQALVFKKKNYKEVLPLAVQSAVAVRKPEYDDWKTRVCIHQDLIYAYVGTDPDGYASLIENALDYMEGELEPEMQCRMCYQSTRAEYQYRRGNLDEARTCALRELSLSKIPHYQASAYAQLCRIAYREGKWDELADFTPVYYDNAEKDRSFMGMATATAWQAVLAQHNGKPDEAAKHYQKALNDAEQLTAAWGDDLYEAIIAYHTLRQDLTAVSQTLTRSINERQGKEAWYEESEARLAHCRILAQLGQLTAADLAAARAVIQKLKNPAPVLAQLDELTSS